MHSGVKISADDKLMIFFFLLELTFHANCLHWRQFAYISCKLSPLETICMRSQILFSGKNKKNITNLSSAELARRNGKS